MTVQIDPFRILPCTNKRDKDHRKAMDESAESGCRDALQPCPTCGRTLSIRREYVGADVYCGHCGCRFVVPRSASEEERATPALSLLERAELLLATVDSSFAGVSRLRHG